MTNFLLSAKTFENGQPIPIQYTADGRDLSPPLSWYSPPKKTKSFLVYMEDTDAGQEPFVHWLLYGIPGNCLELREGLPRAGILESPHGASHGLNSFPENNIGYRGPDPPPGSGVHHYHFWLYALDDDLQLAPGLTKDAVRAAMSGHILGQTEMVCTYERK